jgi:hypothetical protein
VKVRSVPGTCSRSRAPSRIFPSTPVTVEFQRGKPFASVRSLQICWGVDRMFTSTAHAIAKLLRVCVTFGSMHLAADRKLDVTAVGGPPDRQPEAGPGPQRHARPGQRQ